LAREIVLDFALILVRYSSLAFT